jgi:transcriptional regulator with PAS, ATPase and Fis domain
LDYIDFSWVKEFPATITVCDLDGTLLEMNDKAARGFQKDGGYDLIGSNILDCHPDPARAKLERLMEGRQQNVYTIEKNGIKKLIYQTPWFKNGQVAGFIEFSFEIPFDIPHHLRDQPSSAGT